MASSFSSLCSLTNENDFNFESTQFACKINRIILFKISKSNPHIASLWQYFLVLCNYQDTEYWSSSIENINDYKTFGSKLSSPNDLIDPNLTLNDLDKSDLKSKIKSRLNYSQKHNNNNNNNNKQMIVYGYLTFYLINTAIIILLYVDFFEFFFLFTFA